MAQKTLNFTKSKALDLTTNKEFGTTIVKVDGKKFTMTKFKSISGHDDSLPYDATLCVDGNPLCTCHNDGWGGETFLYPVENKQELLEEINKMVATFKWKYNKTTLALNLPLVADILANTCYTFRLTQQLRARRDNPTQRK